MDDLYELVEHQESPPLELTIHDRDLIARTLPNAIIRPVAGTADHYTINPRNYVGLLRLGEQTLLIRPKISIERALFLIAYSLDPKHWRDSLVGAADHRVLHEAVAIPFARHASRAVRQHVLHGYRTVEDSLHGIRGTVRFDDQLRRRQRLTVPIEVTFDEHTDDIVENQLLLAAAIRLLRLKRLSPQVRNGIAQVAERLASVSLVAFHPMQVPDVTITRLNAHYAPALAFARLILRHRTLELEVGNAPNDSLLFDMSTIFETFVHTALKESLQLPDRCFPRAGQHPPLSLDANHDVPRVALKPDLSWWENGRCVAIGDIKYKRTDSGDGRHPDLYQLVAYTHAARLAHGTLIYASTESPTSTHVTIGGTQLHIEAVDLGGSPQDILNEIGAIAERLRQRAQSYGEAAARAS